jgi:hypothetical protein
MSRYRSVTDINAAAATKILKELHEHQQIEGRSAGTISREYELQRTAELTILQASK